MVFIVHWVESWNWLLKFSKGLNENPEKAWMFFALAPIYKLMSVVYLFSKKSHDVVDVYKFKDLVGETRVIRNFGWSFFIKKFRPLILERIFNTVLVSQGDDPARYPGAIGLGALTKAEWLTAGGKLIVDVLGEKLRVPLVHGDTLTAAALIRTAVKLIDKFSVISPIAITGATSKIGRPACIVLAAKRGLVIKMYTKSQQRFEEIKKEADAYGCGHLLRQVTSLKDLSDCKLWITGKAIPSGKKLLRAMPKNSIALNFSVPNPLTRGNLKNRKDVYSVEGGLLAYDPSITTLSFTMRLRPGLTYACHAGTMVHAAKGWTHHEVGQVAVDTLHETWKAANDLGFFLPEFPIEQKVMPKKGRLGWKIQNLAHQLGIF